MAQNCGPVVGSCKHGKRTSQFNKSKKFLKWPRHSAFQGRPCTRKSVVFFSSISITFTAHNCFLHHLTPKVDTGDLCSSGISHSVKSQKSKDLVCTTAEAWNHTSYRHSVVHKVLARNQLSELLFSIHWCALLWEWLFPPLSLMIHCSESFSISSLIHKLIQHSKITA